MLRKKRGISAVVATVLLVLITFIAVGLVWAFVLPMIKKSLEGGTTCFELRDYAEIVEGDYTCSSTNTKIMIQRGAENYIIKGFTISILKEGSSKRYDVTMENPDNVEMLDGGDFELPEPGEARTYKFDVANGERAELGVISEQGKVCSMESVNIPVCSN